MCFVFCISYFACILCSKATVRAHLSLMCLVQLPGLLCYHTTVVLLLNKINDDDDETAPVEFRLTVVDERRILQADCNIGRC